MAHPPRAPLVVLPEASGFPGDFAAPWTANPEEVESAAAPFGTAGDPRGRVSLPGSRRVPVRPLPRPVVPCASEAATLSPSGAARDVDSEVGAHPDTLRSLNLMHGDLVTLTERVGGETRVGTIVAATRWARADEAAESESARDDDEPNEKENGDVSDDRDEDEGNANTVRPGFLYLPPALRHNLRLHVRFAAARAAAVKKTSATKTLSRRAEEDDDPFTSRDEESRREVTVTVARLAQGALRTCASIAIAPVRIPKPAVPGTTPSFAAAIPANAAALEAALADHFKRADRLLAVGDVFAATCVEPVDVAVAMAKPGFINEAMAKTIPRTRRVAAHFVVVAADDVVSAAADSEKETPLKVSARSSQINPQTPSFLVSADRATCVMVAAAAAGAPSAREAETFLGLSNDLRDERDDSTDVSFSDAFSSPPLRFSDGAESSLASLVAALAPAAHPASARAFKLAVCVSLNGPKGVGKRSVARAAADALRLARVEVNCHEMLADAGGGGSGDRVIVALEAAFDAAAAVGPALLYLRRFDALCASPGGDGEACATRLARALRKCVAKYAYGGHGVGDKNDASLSSFARGDDDGEDETSSFDFTSSFKNNGPVFLVAGVDESSSTPDAVRARFTHEVRVRALNEGWRLEALRDALLPSDGRFPIRGTAETVAMEEEETRVALEAAAAATSGATPREIRALASRVGAEAFFIRSKNTDPRAPESFASLCSIKPSLDAALRWSEGRANAAFGAPSVPSTTWDDVGGLEDVKAAIRDVVERPLKRAAEARLERGGLTSNGVVVSDAEPETGTPKPLTKPLTKPRRLGGRSGALLYGPPGTGKTLLAKAVATECALRFLSVKGPELVNMYVGESERNVREVFERARLAAPCVVFFDELDALAPMRGKGTDGGGVMDRVVSQLVAELDECVAFGHHRAPDPTTMVFAIGATNRPDLVDPALLRPGRFDKLLYVGVDSSVEGRARVLAAMTKRFKFAPDVGQTTEEDDDADERREEETSAEIDEKSGPLPSVSRASLLSRLASAVPATFTGADMYALCADAWMRAAKRAVAKAGLNARTDDFGAETNALGDAPEVAVTPSDFDAALENLTPSLTDEEVARYARMRAEFEGSRKAAKRE